MCVCGCQCPSDRNILEELSQGKLASLSLQETQVPSPHPPKDEVSPTDSVALSIVSSCPVQDIAFDLDNEELDLDIDTQVRGTGLG